MDRRVRLMAFVVPNADVTEEGWACLAQDVRHDRLPGSCSHFVFLSMSSFVSIRLFFVLVSIS